MNKNDCDHCHTEMNFLATTKISNFKLWSHAVFKTFLAWTGWTILIHICTLIQFGVSMLTYIKFNDQHSYNAWISSNTHWIHCYFSTNWKFNPQNCINCIKITSKIQNPHRFLYHTPQTVRTWQVLYILISAPLKHLKQTKE